MTQFPHDEFAKELLSELCQDYGQAVSSADVKSERRQIDFLFIPIKQVPTSSDTLGLLGKMLQSISLLEVYRNPVKPKQIRECLNKLFDMEQKLVRETKKTNKQLDSTQPVRLWLITPTISETILNLFGAFKKGNWSDGVYFLPEGLNTAIIAVHQLPYERETLWLRILGRGKVQTSAVEELKNLPNQYFHRDNVLELVYGLWETLKRNQKESEKEKLEQEDLEVIMSLRTIFQERLTQEKKEGIQQGIQQGVQQGIQETLKSNIVKILEKRFETIPNKLINSINNLNDRSKLQELLLETINVSSWQEFENLLD